MSETIVRVKICGIRTAESIDAAVSAGAHAIGFVRAPSSPRFVSREDLVPLVQRVPPFVCVVLVYRDSGIDEITLDLRAIAPRAAIVQLHGHEDEAFASSVPATIIRALPWSAEGVRRWQACGAIKALLLDAPDPGSGVTAPWEEIAAGRASIELPFVLAGGLDAENVARALTLTRPEAVDVSSGVESSPGVKDSSKIAAFCKAVRRWGR